MLVPRAKVTTSIFIIWLKHSVELLGCYINYYNNVMGGENAEKEINDFWLFVDYFLWLLLRDNAYL